MASSFITKRFIVLGDAGAGKSSFINFLFNYFNGSKHSDEIFCEHPKVKIVIPCANWTDLLDEKYKNNKSEHNINDQTQSQTQLCTTYTVCRGNDIHLEIIDTPGFNDTNGADMDTTNLTMIEKALKEVPFLSGIIMVVNGTSPRLGVSFKNFLHMLHQIWPNDLMNNCVAILTNCDELSVNLDSSVLKRDLNVDKSKTFHLQNSSSLPARF
jgi:predicted GTPase